MRLEEFGPEAVVVVLTIDRSNTCTGNNFFALIVRADKKAGVYIIYPVWLPVFVEWFLDLRRSALKKESFLILSTPFSHVGQTQYGDLFRENESEKALRSITISLLTHNNANQGCISPGQVRQTGLPPGE